VGTKPEKNSGAVMGLLNSNTLNDYVTQTIPNNARNIWDAILRSPDDLKKLFGNPNGAQDVMAAVEKQKQIPVNPQTFIDQGMNLAGMAPVGGLLGHTVYHASPHKFNKFDMSKIGTGEGAQAYGHGLYMAESPAVSGMDGEYFNAFKNTPAAIASGGPFSYKVDIPDEAIPRMLDWDKPISQQTPEVKKMLAAAKLTADNPDFAFWSKAYGKQYELGKPPEMTGGALVQALSNSGKAAAGARDLKSLGIPGIRYLDQASRGSNKGTSNYVLFDDQLPRILEVNGKPTGLLSYADEAKKSQENNGLLGRYGAKPNDIADELSKERAVRVSSIEDDYRLPNLHNAVPQEYLPKQYGKKTVTVYRGVPSSVKDAIIRPGDWVSLDKQYAAQHGTGETGKSKVISMEVPAESVGWAGTDMNEWFYVPKDK